MMNAEYHRRYSKKWYNRNKELTKTRSYNRRKKLVDFKHKKILEYLSEHPCIDCGETDIVVLQFDHVKGKKRYSLSEIISGGHSWATVLKEIKKCEVRCANDHERKTARERKKNYKLQFQISKGLSSN